MTGGQDTALAEYNMALSELVLYNRSLVHLMRKAKTGMEINMDEFEIKAHLLQSSVERLCKAQENCGYPVNVGYLSDETLYFEEDDLSFEINCGDIVGDREAAGNLACKWLERSRNGEKGYDNFKFEVAKLILGLL